MFVCSQVLPGPTSTLQFHLYGWNLRWMDKGDVYKIVGASLSACQAGGVVSGLKEGIKHLYSMMRDSPPEEDIAFLPQR